MPIDFRRLDTTVETTRASYDTVVATLERQTIRQVADEMVGQDANRVRAALVARMAARLPGADLDQRNLQHIATAISQGRFHAWGDVRG
jgi:hypothetical protein